MYAKRKVYFIIKNGGVAITNIWKAIVKIVRIKNDNLSEV